MHSLKQKLQRALLRLHRDEGGAVFVLCLAACLFLFMLGLLIFDVGETTRNKVDTQMAADSAAYSQAAVKARAMNMVAFGNVGKRTISGIRNMYASSAIYYLAWWAGQCGKCRWYRPIPCLNCAGNVLTVARVALDFGTFAVKRLSSGGDKISKQLKALDEFQEQMVSYAPYWALGEAVVRGVRNGAHVITTYPMPDTPEYGPLPVKKTSKKIPGVYEACLAPAIVNPVSLGTGVEWETNFAQMKQNSDTRPLVARKGPREVHNRVAAAAGCLLSAAYRADAKYNIPYHLKSHKKGSQASGKGHESDEGYLHRSNFIWSYRHTPDTYGKLRDNYDGVNDRDYHHNLRSQPAAGMWAMARGEVFYDPKNDPNIISGDHRMWMFHPSWIGKLRPVMLKNEHPPVKPSEMWDEARSATMSQAMLHGVNVTDFALDLLYMEKVMTGLDGTIESRQVMDGIAK